MKVTIEGLLSELPEDTEIVKDHAGTEGNGHSELSVTPEELSDFAQANNTDMKCVIAAAFGYSVSRFTGSTHSLINCCREGRTYPLVTDCSNRSISDFIRSSAENYAASFDHNGAFQKVSDITLSFDSKIDSGIFFKIEIGDSITVDHFNTSDYSAPTVSSLASVFDKVLSGMISCDSLSDIIYTTDDDISAIEEINNTSRPLTHSDTLSSFLATASSHPDSVMLRYLDRTYTFADCDRISDSIASALVSSGIAPGDNVAIMVPRSEWYLLCILGVMKAGAAYVPIEIAYPDERVSFMMSDALVKAILITEETAQRAASLCDAKLIDCTKIPESKFKPVSVLPSDTVTILYTSGTTGKPKGTKVTHIGLENFSEWMVSFHGLTEKDTIGLYASIGFDAHMITFFPPMVCGCSADIIPNDILLDVGGIADFLKRRNISIILFTTPLAKILLPRWDGNGCRFLIGGEKVGPVNFVDFPICNCYGPTENTIVTTAGMLEPGCTIECIGRLLPNVKGYILDREKRRLPKGAIGELYASGYQLSSGYLNRPDKNRESFIDNPFSDEEGFERMYATGDYVRFMDDGRIEFIGRKDSQLKIRGNRVELMEVEACIRMMPEVKDVVVRAVPGFNGEKELCAYIVSPEQVSADALRSFVSERKPSYMVPSFVIQLDSIPLTVNCKVDTSALPIPDVSSMRAPYAAPRNDMEKKLCDSFSSVLGVQEVGIDDDFILLGGDSLKAISVQNEVGGIAAAVTILRYRTPREICSSSAQAAPVIRNDPEKGSILSAQQLFVYNAILNGKDPVAFTVTVYVPVPPGVSGDDAFNAVSKVVDAHPVLSCTVSDSRLVPGERPSVIKCKTAPAKPSFDCNGRLCEFYIVDGKTVIGQLSHLIIDAVSLDILRRDIYDALHGKQPPFDDGYLYEVPPMADMDSAVKFYDRMMNGTDSVLTIDPFQPSERARTMIVPLTDDVAAASKRQGISIGSFLTAAFAYTLTRYTGDSRAVFFTVDHGRYAPEVMDAVGLYARIFPICINCSGKSIKEFLLKAHEVISGAMFNARMTFGECVARYGIRSDFMFQYSGGLFFSSDNEEEGRYEDDESLRDISFYAVQKQDRIDVKVVFSPRYTAISDSMCDTFLSVVKGLMNDGNLPEIRPQKK